MKEAIPCKLRIGRKDRDRAQVGNFDPIEPSAAVAVQRVRHRCDKRRYKGEAREPCAADRLAPLEHGERQQLNKEHPDRKGMRIEREHREHDVSDRDSRFWALELGDEEVRRKHSEQSQEGI